MSASNLTGLAASSRHSKNFPALLSQKTFFTFDSYLFLAITCIIQNNAYFCLHNLKYTIMLRHPITSEPLAAEIFNVHVFIGVLPRDMAFTGETDHLRTEKDKMFPRMDYRYAMSFYCSICEAHSKAQKHDALNYQTPDRIAEITLYNGTLPILKSSFIFRKNS